MITSLWQRLKEAINKQEHYSVQLFRGIMELIVCCLDRDKNFIDDGAGVFNMLMTPILCIFDELATLFKAEDSTILLLPCTDEILAIIARTLYTFIKYGVIGRINCPIQINSDYVSCDSQDISCFICEQLVFMNATSTQSVELSSLTIAIIHELLFPETINDFQVLKILLKKWGAIFPEVFAKGVVSAINSGAHSVETVAQFCRILSTVANTNESTKQLLMDLEVQKVMYVCLSMALDSKIESAITVDIVTSCANALTFLSNQPGRASQFFSCGVLERVLAHMDRDFCHVDGASADLQISGLKAIRALSTSTECADYIMKVGADKLICESANMISDLIVSCSLDEKYDYPAVFNLIEQIAGNDATVNSNSGGSSEYDEDRCVIS